MAKKILKSGLKKIIISGLIVIGIAVLIFVTTTKSSNSSSKATQSTSDLPESVVLSSETILSQNSNESKSSSVSSQNSISSETKSLDNQTKSSSLITKKYKQFSGLEFQSLYETVSSNYTGVTRLNQKPAITGDTAADSRIQSLAENRGYKLRPEASNKKINVAAMESFNNLKNAAKKEANLNFVLVSGFRAVEDQKNIFLSALGSNYNNSQIADGEADNRINEILKTRSVPGYSRHHSGYTMDFGCNSSNLVNFKNTPCFTWISKNNYENAKRFGVIPSYPSGTDNQGPDPEEWEYVWVGEQNLIQKF